MREEQDPAYEVIRRSDERVNAAIRELDAAIGEHATIIGAFFAGVTSRAQGDTHVHNTTVNDSQVADEPRS